MFNDVLFRIKTSDEILDPLRVFVSDKEFVKLYVTALVGAEHVVPTLAVLRSPEEALAYVYPPDCVMKPTHSAGEIIIREGNAPIDHAKIQRWFASNCYDIDREANYRFLKPKVIVEPLVFGRGDAPDYKVFCNNGVPRAMLIVMGRRTCRSINLYTTDWQLLPGTLEYSLGNGADRPSRLGEILDVASKLTQGLGFVRVDFYANDEQVLVGEITNLTGNAVARFVPRSVEKDYSRLIFGEEEEPSA